MHRLNKIEKIGLEEAGKALKNRALVLLFKSNRFESAIKGVVKRNDEDLKKRAASFLKDQIFKPGKLMDLKKASEIAKKNIPLNEEKIGVIDTSVSKWLTKEEKAKLMRAANDLKMAAYKNLSEALKKAMNEALLQVQEPGLKKRREDRAFKFLTGNIFYGGIAPIRKKRVAKEGKKLGRPKKVKETATLVSMPEAASTSNTEVVSQQVA